jgi:hypothetical protein
MGLGDLFRRLRSDQRAMPDPGSAEFQRAVEGSALPGSTEMGQQGWASVEADGEGETVVATGTDAASLEAAGVPADSAQATADALRQLAQAFGGASAAQVSVERGGDYTLDLRGLEGLRDQMLATLREHGVDPDSGQPVDATEVPGLQEALLRDLAESGVDIGRLGEDGASGGEPPPSHPTD